MSEHEPLMISASTTLPVAVIGAGPVGLAAALHLRNLGLDVVVFEMGDDVGAAVSQWDHVQLFTSMADSVDALAAQALIRHGWRVPDADMYPTGEQLRTRYLIPLAELPVLAPTIRRSARVCGVSRLQHDKLRDGGRQGQPFELRIAESGRQYSVLARAVVDASGTLQHPNPLGSGGLPALGEAESAERITYGMPDVLGRAQDRYADRRTLVVGSGHSAIGVLTDLLALRARFASTDVSWAVRSTVSRVLRRSRGGALPRRGSLARALGGQIAAGSMRIHEKVAIEEVELVPDGVRVRYGGCWLGPFDEIIAATGYRPDLALLGELRLALDPMLEAPVALAPLIDPNIHSCATVPIHGADVLDHPEGDVYIAGMKSYGRAPTFLMQTGYAQVRSIAERIAGAHPSVGVCQQSSCGPSLSVLDVVDGQIGGATSETCVSPASVASCTPEQSCDGT